MLLVYTTMASQGDIAAVEVYTTDKPAMAVNILYKGMVLVSKVKSRNMFSDIGSGQLWPGGQTIRKLCRRIEKSCWWGGQRSVQADGGYQGGVALGAEREGGAGRS